MILRNIHALLYALHLSTSFSVFYEGDGFHGAGMIPSTNNAFVHIATQQHKMHNPRVTETISEIGNPSNILVHHDVIYISLFKEDKVLIGHIGEKFVSGFADGSYCTDKSSGKIECGIVSGPWGLLVSNETLFVSSFGSGT
jgi:hypothetical protein